MSALIDAVNKAVTEKKSVHPHVYAAELMCRPHVIYKPDIHAVHGGWIATNGFGLNGYGETPEAACLDFDRAFKDGIVNRVGAPDGD